MATFLLAVVVFGLGGWKWSVPILTFFVLSSLLSKMGKAKKRASGELHEKGSTRDYAQVFANRGVPGLLVLASLVVPAVDWYPVYLGAVAAVTADTWGTEIGMMTRGRTVLITTFRPVVRGANGGVSLRGFLCAAAGSLAHWAERPGVGEFDRNDRPCGAGARAGRIPGAVNRPFALDVSTNNTVIQFKPISELAEAYAKLIAPKDTSVVVSCRTGHQASQTYFVLRHLLGYRRVSWYDGGWAEWASRPELPVETGGG